MKNLLFVLFCFLLNSNLLLAQEDAEKIVQQSLEAYNARDIEAFMALFDEDIEMYNFQDPEVAVKGIKAVREVYQRMFDASPELHSKILNRIVFDNKVIDYEYITGASGRSDPFELVFIYEIENGKIIRTTAIRK